MFVVGAGAEDATAAEVEFVWSAGEEGSHRETVLADDQLVQTAWITRFKQPGLHTIGRLFLSTRFGRLALIIETYMAGAIFS